eukprot:TRINITY_DN111350_c0_g1_i1.p1 TRINITY_DN111350_c0_g1~~TRINITY_DN111350_c0_g1_i1.p1  ORF type:complete len:496 (+),score=64.01 TRINITY_DN111350_c0_g1_i1:60-1547(+)
MTATSTGRRSGRWGSSAQAATEENVTVAALTVYSCGCGHLGAELLCSLLFDAGIRSVLDVRELDHSVKRPWFNSDVLEITMQNAGLDYNYIGEDREDVSAVAAHVVSCRGPVCLLGVRALARECPRLWLCDSLQQVIGWTVIHLQPNPEAPPKLELAPHAHSAILNKKTLAAEEVANLKAQLEAALRLKGRWQDRVRARYKVVLWEDWDRTRQMPTPEDGPLAVQLPFDTMMLIVPGFMTKQELFRLQQSSLPGAIEYSQPRRQVRNPDGSFTQFNEHHKEAWLCNDYHHRDSRRVIEPRIHQGQDLPLWAEELLSDASSVLLAPFNALMCRWEQRGIHVKDGPHTYSTHYGWADETVIGIFAVGATREYRIHGIPWFYGRGHKEVVAVHVPLVEGMLVAFGGPLKERFLYAQPRDEEFLPERVQFTLQLHADPEVSKNQSDARYSWTEDGEAPEESEFTESSCKLARASRWQRSSRGRTCPTDVRGCPSGAQEV